MSNFFSKLKSLLKEEGRTFNMTATLKKGKLVVSGNVYTDKEKKSPLVFNGTEDELEAAFFTSIENSSVSNVGLSVKDPNPKEEKSKEVPKENPVTKLKEESQKKSEPKPEPKPESKPQQKPEAVDEIEGLESLDELDDLL